MGHLYTSMDGESLAYGCIEHTLVWILEPHAGRKCLGIFVSWNSLWTRGRLGQASQNHENHDASCRGLTGLDVQSLAGWWLGHPSEKYERQLG